MLDDGEGMGEAALVEAMRFGGAGPACARGSRDLGRFGLGLKTASLSQCRRLVVASRSGGPTSRLEWDVDAVERSGSWTVGLPDRSPAGSLSSSFDLATADGTLVSWDRMDPLGGLYGLDRETFNARVAEVRAHLAMTFHRFLNGEGPRLAIEVNGRPVKAWDPFCREHPATAALPRDVIRGHDSAVVVRPYVLPHRDRFASERDYEEAGGPEGWGERQGFYVYRGDRLVLPGGWLGLGGTRLWTREESSRLARIAVELRTDADADWRIDVRKSLARPPAWARQRLTSVGADARRRAREVFAWRGAGRPRGERIRDDEAREVPQLWTGGAKGSGVRYRITRDHPAVVQLGAELGSGAPQLEGLLAALELTVPVERIWLDVTEEGGTTDVTLDLKAAEPLVASLAALIAATAPVGSPGLRLEALMRSLGVSTPELRHAVLRFLEER